MQAHKQDHRIEWSISSVRYQHKTKKPPLYTKGLKMIYYLKKYFIIALMMGSSHLCIANSEENINLKIQVTGQKNMTRNCSSLANCLITISQPFNHCLSQPGFITVKNNSKIAAKNIRSYSTNPDFVNYVTQSNTCPTSLPPQATCSISFFTNSSVSFLASNIIIKGSNTKPTYFNMQAIPCTVPAVNAVISSFPSSLTLTTVSPGDNGIVSIKNDPTSTVNATNITADLSEAGASLSVGYNNCSSVAPGEVCTITLTSHATLPTTNLPIKGTNTNLIYVAVAVNEATISAYPSTFNLPQGGGTQMVTITNNGPVDAYGVGVFSGPDLGITVSGVCASPMAPEDICQLTFTSGSNTGVTMAEISGSNTNSVTEKITVAPALNTTLTATITASPAVINVNGVGVEVSIENTGSTTAYNVVYTLPSQWNGVNTSGSCGNIEPGPANACHLTFNATQPNIANTIEFSADNVAPTVQSPAIAFSYQGYLVYAVTPTPPTSGTAYVIYTSDSTKAWDSSGGGPGGACVGCTQTNATSNSDGFGNTNTISTVLSSQADNNAAGYCHILSPPNGAWYLPAKNELNNIYHNLKSLGFGAFGSNSYWSSTEDDSNNAWGQNFPDGNQGARNKGASFAVRCVRALSY